jgi:uncharacterized Zn finger protein (UPF0148 family)
MPHTITCPTPDCGRQLRVPDTLVGKKVKCPSCGNTFVAQVDEPPPPPEEPEERDEQQEEERPVRRKITREDDDEDDDDRPRKRRRRGYLKEHRGNIVLILGILGIVGVGAPVTSIIAWVMGNNDLKEIRAGRMDPAGEGTTNTGRILGMIATILWSVFCVGCCTFYAIIALAAAANAH